MMGMQGMFLPTRENLAETKKGIKDGNKPCIPIIPCAKRTAPVAAGNTQLSKESVHGT